jgi:hypothetical protein
MLFVVEFKAFYPFIDHFSALSLPIFSYF